VVLAILLDMQTAMRAITTSDGYFYTVKETSVVLDPEPLELVPATELPYVVFGDMTSNGRSFATSRPVAIKDDFTVDLWFRVDVPMGANKARKLTAGWNFAADMEVALTRDPQRGERALYTYVEQPTIHAGVPASNQVYGQVPVRVTLQRAYGVSGGN
jgi:hypothetical protein